MQDVLIALQTDLASSIAIRYLCQLEKLGRLNVQAIHVPDMDDLGRSPGGGWVQQTWENAIFERVRDEIARMVPKELFHSSMGELKIVPGERDQVIREEMDQNHYDFFIEGLLHSFEPNRFFEKLDSPLYRNLPCPALMVKNLVDLTRGIQIVGTLDTFSSVLAWFLKLWDEIPAEPDILVCHFEASKEKGTFLENDSDLISDIDGRFFKYGKKIASIKTAKGSSNELALLVRDHALLVSPLPESSSHMAQMLAKSPCPILFCPEFTID